LLLEKSALTAHGRVEKIAKRKLKMIEPIDVQVIRSSR
jgi:cell division protein FtsL